MSLATIVDSILPVSRDLESEIQAHLDDLTKPRGSLGRLEACAMRYALARGSVKPTLTKKRIYCFAGDHGVAAEGVSAFPPEVTPQMVFNMLAGGAAINVLARHAGAELKVVDMGVAADLADAPPGLIDRKVALGTGNIAREAAMTRAQAEQAVLAGVELAQQAADDGVDLLGTGDMGIANTTPSAALYCAYLGLPAGDIVGRGTGIDDEALDRKARVVRQALELHAETIVDGDPLAILAALGGYEIAGICGLALGGASRGVPVVVDGFISTAGALAACRICPAVADYLFFSHMSQELGHSAVLAEMGARPLLDLDLRLGEGTGGALAMTLIDASLKIYNEMATFSSAGVSDAE